MDQLGRKRGISENVRIENKQITSSLDKVQHFIEQSKKRGAHEEA